jgi:hypothetical protein
MIVFSAAGLYRHVKSFAAYYHDSRMHLSLAQDALRPVQRLELAASLPCLKSVACTTDMNDERPEPS